MQIYKCNNLCTISDKRIKCKECGKMTKYLCDVETKDELEFLTANLQKEKFGEFKTLKEKK